MANFYDGLRDLYNGLVNRRNPLNNNSFVRERFSARELNQFLHTGIGNKIVFIKTNYALNDTLQFNQKEDEKIYKEKLQLAVSEAVRFMFGFGRGVIVVGEKGDNLETPLKKSVDPEKAVIRVFDGGMITVPEIGRDLMGDRYYQPKLYQIRSAIIHHSRIADFSYFRPIHDLLPEYQYGGISEFELIANELKHDAIISRASAGIMEKASNVFYKVKGFKNLLQQKKHKELLEYLSKMEDLRGEWGAGVLDAEDEIEVINQTIANLADGDQISLRRLSVVTSIPEPMLVGESVKGLNSSGKTERMVFLDMTEANQQNYILQPLNKCMSMLGLGEVKFRENQGEMPLERVEYEGQVLQNALNLDQLGFDARSYIREKGIVSPDPFEEFLNENGD